jgi:hypothetical protein
MIIKEYQFTTHPGTYYNVHFRVENPNGVAILIPGQYHSTWQLGRFKDHGEALIQVVGKPVKVWRSKNGPLNYDTGSEQYTENSTIDIHMSDKNECTPHIGRWSAGCQVLKCWNDFLQFREVCHESSRRFGNSFTYTLLNAEDIHA